MYHRDEGNGLRASCAVQEKLVLMAPRCLKEAVHQRSSLDMRPHGSTRGDGARSIR